MVVAPSTGFVRKLTRCASRCGLLESDPSLGCSKAASSPAQMPLGDHGRVLKSCGSRFARQSPALPASYRSHANAHLHTKDSEPTPAFHPTPPRTHPHGPNHSISQSLNLSISQSLNRSIPRTCAFGPNPGSQRQPQPPVPPLLEPAPTTPISQSLNLSISQSLNHSIPGPCAFGSNPGPQRQPQPPIPPLYHF